MTTIRKQCIYFGLLLVLLPQLILTANGQSKLIQLQRIVFKDKAFERNLSVYVNQTGMNVISLTMEKKNNAYLYKLAGVYFFEDVKDYSTQLWGRWRNRIIIFSAGLELKDVCAILDTTTFTNLVRYIEPILPKQFSSTVGESKKEHNAVIIDGLEWTFKIENGKEVWLYDNRGYDSRDIIAVPVPK